MPIYEYDCIDKNCHQKTFEKLVQHKDIDKNVFCPVCNKKAKKLPSSFGFSLKGTGFHVNDYANPDRFIGQDAEKKWTTISERQTAKKKFRKENESKHLGKITNKDYITTDKELFKVQHKSEAK